MNTRGPSTEPWGTPWALGRRSGGVADADEVSVCEMLMEDLRWERRMVWEEEEVVGDFEKVLKLPYLILFRLTINMQEMEMF